MPINVELIKLARQALEHRKVAFQPPGGAPPGMPPGMDPSMMGGGMPPGAPPMDPSMLGGMPPGMPMDPSMMGGMPPMDPMAMGGAPMPGGEGLTADSIRQIIQEEMAKSPVNGAATGKPGKPDLLAMSMDIFQMKKMLFDVINAMGLPVSRDILDGPNRDPNTGAPAAATPQPTPPSEAPLASAIKPIEPMKGAFPSAPAEGGMGEKAGSMGSVYVTSAAASGKIQSKAAALAACLRKANR